MKTLSPAEAADLIRSDDDLAVPLGPGQPSTFLHALGERESFDGLTVFSALLVDLFPLFARPGVRLLSGFYGPAERALAAAGHDIHFIPADFRRFSAISRQLAPRVMATNATLPDADGRLSLSLHAGATVDELHRCGADPKRLLIVEANPALPRTLGLPPEHTHSLHVDEVDVIVEGDRPITTLDDGEASDIEQAIAEHVQPYVTDGSTLQTGIGGIPNAVVSLLAKGSGGDYGIHSEMFTTGLMHLHQAGKVTNRKGLYDGISVATFALGSLELYEWLDGQEEVRFLPVEAINTPSIVARNRDMVSINGALQVDLAGQVVADTRGGEQFSGIGGHEDFVSGASFAEHGRSLLCMPSTAGRDEARVSRISALLAPGTMVTTPRHQVDVIITEYGAAELRGQTTEGRRERLIAIAHPDFRDELRKATQDRV